MKLNSFLRLSLLSLVAAASALALTARADDTNNVPTPDKLTTCPVSGDKLDGDMGKPFVFTYQGQEVKLCCHDCKKEFDKNPDKFMAKIRAADKTPQN
jgi:YHS domain-containing protein